MGEFADEVADNLRDALADRLDSHAWATERYIGRTPVDVVGEGEPLLLVELEWRRADPSNNTVKLFRHLVEDNFDGGEVHLVQLFSRYYDLQSGGVSSKRANAEFVGKRVPMTVDDVTYTPLTLAVDPPKRGGERPDGWREAVDWAAERIERAVRRPES
ncbi:hypothetical protein [Natronomonas amylolytica]|uniref:hypothetical protein n=1 Tax=Natronomonas amylolytica TaxID=3108498 RepID=UPI00300AD323